MPVRTLEFPEATWGPGAWKSAEQEKCTPCLSAMVLEPVAAVNKNSTSFSDPGDIAMILSALPYSLG